MQEDKYITDKKYFTWDEMTYSFTAVSQKIDNSPNEEEKNNLIELCTELLDPVREGWETYCKENNLPSPYGIKINSGFRNEATNTAVGGSKTSAHRLALAADTMPTNGRIKEYQEFVLSFIQNLEYDQYIIEKPNVNGIASWIHLGYKNNSRQHRRQNMKYIKNAFGKWVYVNI